MNRKSKKWCGNINRNVGGNLGAVLFIVVCLQVFACGSANLTLAAPLGGLNIGDEIKPLEKDEKEKTPSAGDAAVSESDLYIILQDVHEVLRRLKLDLIDLRHEANRRQYKSANVLDQDLQVIDPWSSDTPALLAMAGGREKESTLLPPRPKFLQRSIASLEQLVPELDELLNRLFKEEEKQGLLMDSQVQERHRNMLNLLDQLKSSLAGLKAIAPKPANLSLRDSSASFEIKCHDLDALCQTEWSKLKLSKMTGK
ncbi:MAG: hypothetical protein LCH63_10785 [Candidatus Melainabacteria bacterium]|nr:hypothetical protein [Candidatus Melainabacteria bacterium]